MCLCCDVRRLCVPPAVGRCAGAGWVCRFDGDMLPPVVGGGLVFLLVTAVLCGSDALFFWCLFALAGQI